MPEGGLQPFTGKTTVVTGSGRRGGLGEAIVRRLARAGAAVVVSDLGQAGGTEETEAFAAELRGEGADASTFACDVRRYRQVQALAAHAVARHGSLDIWVNNAGIGYIMKPLLDVEPDDWNAVIDVNLTGRSTG